MDTTIPGVRAQAGFTLLELMVTLGILAILMGIAAPGMRDTLANVRMSAHVNDLASDLALARTEAVKRGVPVRLCPSANGTACSGIVFSIGWFVYVDTDNDQTRDANEPVLRYRAANSKITITLTPASGNIPFRPTGITTTGAADWVFTLCDGRGGYPNGGRIVRVSPTGRAVITRIPGC